MPTNNQLAVQNKKSFELKVETCIDQMKDDDVGGQILCFIRVNGFLLLHEEMPFDIKLSDIYKYEIVIFDVENERGENSDSWKHVFFPEELKDFFVREH